MLSHLAARHGLQDCADVRPGQPDLDPGGHAKISTGKSGNKFGIPISRARAVYARAAALPGIAVTGVVMHAGSQITDPALRRCLRTACGLRPDAACRRPSQSSISRSRGGLGIPYHEDNEPPPHPDRYAEIVKRNTRDLDCRLIFEPGRLIVGNAGIPVTQVIYVKRGKISWWSTRR